MTVVQVQSALLRRINAYFGQAALGTPVTVAFPSLSTSSCRWLKKKILTVLISKVGQAAWIICLEEVFCTEPRTGKAVAGLGFIPAVLPATWEARSACHGWLGTGEHWGSFDVASAVRFLVLNVKEKGESVRELQCSASLTQMGDFFKTPYRQERSSYCFFYISPAQLCPQTAWPETQWEARLLWGHSMGQGSSVTSGCSPWLSLVTYGSHWSLALPDLSRRVPSWGRKRCCSMWGLW